MRCFAHLIGVTSIVLLLAPLVSAQEPIGPSDAHELRREVKELRQLVTELLNRLDRIEHERLPRVDSSKVLVPPPRIQRIATPDPVRSKLRFPFDLERGTAAPIRPITFQRLRDDEMR